MRFSKSFIPWLLLIGVALPPSLPATPPPASETAVSTDDADPPKPECPDLDACMAWLDARVPAKDDGSYGRLCNPAQRELQAFGAQAKQRLLEKLSSGHNGWENLANCILQKFPGLDDADVPALRASLRVHHGGWGANALGRIGTDSAIQALIEDLPNGAPSQTGFALKNLGERALTPLLDFMALHATADDRIGYEAQVVITKMGAVAAVAAEPWRDIAMNPSEALARRIAALRGLEAMGSNAKSVGPSLAELLHDKSHEIRSAAQAAVQAMRDASALKHIIDECPAPGPDLDQWSPASCLYDVAMFGNVAAPYGPKILSHLRSGVGTDRAFAAVTLGMIGYRPATADLIAALQSDDWRLVLASARSLGWLQASEASTALATTARTHWLRAVRDTADEAATAIREETISVPVYNRDADPLGSKDPFNFDMAPFRHDESGACPSAHWSWSTATASQVKDDENAELFKGLREQFGLPHLHAYLEVDAGHLLGTDAGEWGGKLLFQPTQGARVELYGENIRDIEESANGIIALTGIAHIVMNYGLVLGVKHTADGAYVVNHKLPLPGAPSFMVPTAGGEFVIVTTIGAYVLHSGWRMEEAHCVE